MTQPHNSSCVIFCFLGVFFLPFTPILGAIFLPFTPFLGVIFLPFKINSLILSSQKAHYPMTYYNRIIDSYLL